jgi:hypothetical protein
MDEDIYVKREKNITVEGSKVSPLGGDLEGAFHARNDFNLPQKNAAKPAGVSIVKEYDEQQPISCIFYSICTPFVPQKYKELIFS